MTTTTPAEIDTVADLHRIADQDIGANAPWLADKLHAFADQLDAETRGECQLEAVQRETALARLPAIIREVDAHIDARTAEAYREQPLALHWARITKVCEEAGEVWAALSKCTGENPRKGTCGTWDDLLGELGDTVSAAACGIQHITKDQAWTLAVIVAAFEKAHARVKDAEGATP